MTAPEDDPGRFIPASAVKGGPPYRSTPVWDGVHGPWRISAVRIAGDDKLHAVALNTANGLEHAERVDARTPGDLRRWADTLPATAAGAA